MKIVNSDIIRLTEIKQYFLDPPYTFKLYAQSLPLVEEAAAILQKYFSASDTILQQLGDLKQQLDEQSQSADKLRPILKNAAILLNNINNR